MKNLFWLLLLSSCAHWIPTIRSPYNLTSNNGFLVTNIYTNPTQLEHDGKKLVIKYDLIIKNNTDKVRDLDFKQTTISYRSETIPMTCLSVGKKESAFKVQAMETFRIQCTGEINKIDTLGDTRMIINVPLEKSFAQYSYIVRAEDFK